MKQTKIVSTLGPASNNVDTIAKLIESGANVFRFNFSHGDHAEHQERIQMVHEAEKKTGKLVGILLDTKGAEMRTTDQEGGKFIAEKGKTMRVSMDATLVGNPDKIAVTYPGLFDDTHVGGHVLIDDGLVDLLITEKDEANKELVVEVQNTGKIGSKKGVNAPGVEIRLPGITEKDADDIRFGLTQNINFIAASFVRKAQDVLDIRAILEETGNEHVHIIPKIESQEGIDNIDEILEVSDGLMIARGDMGVEIPFQNVPFVQKSLIQKCNALGKPVITATQMVDSMQENPRPTRAEVSDVANAVLDGTDGTMLSGESANGEYPVEAVSAMAAIDLRSEESMYANNTLSKARLADYPAQSETEALAAAAVRTSESLGAKAIVVSTKSGHTANLVSKFRPNAKIVASTFSENTQRSLTVVWGVLPVLTTEDKAFDDAVKAAKDNDVVASGDKVVVISGNTVSVVEA
ncbi:pyruvate kinase [Holzapfeliella floricola]|uniref:Pyruvate kinase n=1 Tax=Holzapfeliella floricola DSM 23037 = JCM 16512 TaxID=1423744 RepID=A0A0R2DU02_9LACO|nr:pyruvate kinase [Holzapfeliella floricola DSM 23037 = JCM 16512]